MTFKEYQDLANSTAIYPNTFNNLPYSFSQLASEAGEVNGKYAKLLRDENGVINERFKESLKKELGDVLWSIADICCTMGWTMEEVAVDNIAKLHGRKERGTLSGSGDER